MFVDVLINIFSAIIIAIFVYMFFISYDKHGPNSKDIIDKIYLKNNKKILLEPFICGSV
jgi:hypothetical protein|uniref:Uncharacterized protein n=1 Tax=viral metagenome TaxID=1070528 RepID=A0A6C0DYK5_9ZZZZ